MKYKLENKCDFTVDTPLEVIKNFGNIKIGSDVRIKHVYAKSISVQSADGYWGSFNDEETSHFYWGKYFRTKE